MRLMHSSRCGRARPRVWSALNFLLSALCLPLLNFERVAARRYTGATERMTYNAVGEVTDFALWKVPFTPGQLPPGDGSYVSARCAKPVLLGGATYVGLPPPRPVDKKLPPAWGKQHFTAQDLAGLDELIADLTKGSCPYVVEGCGHGANHDAASELSSLKPGSFGTCALVALGDVLHRRPFGNEIDAHDTVIRIGSPPVADFASHTGYKTDVMLHHYTAGTLPPEYQNVTWVIGGEHSRHYDGTSFVPRSMEQGPWHALGTEIYKYTDPLFKGTLRRASSGLTMVLRLISSGFCSRLDLYGFSPYHNRHYFCSGEATKYHTHHTRSRHSSCRTTKPVHSPALENWLYHYMMQRHPETNVCVYL